ncbi:MAG: cell wall-binding repeat-containing protein [Erysipelotrichaceae bacterium]|nr:cell wall-binding repeat-containing protein [Erysipelotrichaceae bacterium]
MKRILTVLMTVLLLCSPIPVTRNVYAEDDADLDDPIQTVQKTAEEPGENEETVIIDEKEEDISAVEEDLNEIAVQEEEIAVQNEEMTESDENDSETNGGFVTPPLTFHGGDVDTEPLKQNASYQGETINATIPTSYDLRNYNLITKVKDQNPYGTCWSFAAAGSAESGMLKKYGRTLDLSELQLAYCTWTSYQKKDPLNLITYDGNTFSSNNSGKTVLDAGGFEFTADYALASGIGFSDESQCSYVYAQKYLSGERTAPYYSTRFRLKSTRWFSMSEKDVIKSRLMNYGALAVSYYHDYNCFNESTNAYYQNEKQSSNHAVTLVGWDDNYSRYNFISRPAGNGAWLVKNSWGTDWGDNGYFWISYYDTSIKDGLATFYDVELDSTFNANDYHIYQYDGSSNRWSYYYFTNCDAYAANVYKTINNYELLKEVGFFFYGTDLNYTITIYKNVTNTPTSGTKVCTQNGHINEAGYYLIPLDDEVILTKGEKYSVVVKLSSSSSNTVYVLTDKTYGWNYEWYDSNYNQYTDRYDCYNNASSDLSYYSTNGTSWTSLTSLGHSARIKAITITLDDTVDYKVTRLAGKDRIDTAIKTAKEYMSILGYDKLDSVVLTYAWNFPDALAGSFLADHMYAPILLIDKDNANKVCKFIKEVLADDGLIYILGGEKAVSSKWLSSLSGYDQYRLAGRDRFGTNLEILNEFSFHGWPILVCNGWSFADSLSAGATGLPILLVGSKLTEEQKVYLSEHTDSKFYIVGGKAAVSDSVVAEMSEIVTVAGRIAGDDRYGTSVALAYSVFSNPSNVVLAYAWNFPDGLSSGPLAYALGAPILLTDGKKYSLAQEYCEYYGIESGYIMGGTSLVTNKAAVKIFSLISSREILVK